MARRLIPLLDRVLVEKIQPVTKSAGGILLPESAASKINEGVVISVGPGRRAANGNVIPPSVKEGDKVLLPDFGGNSIKLLNKEYFLYRDEEILGVLSQ
mmetsp:Transcript_10784/g.19672  ORF Transcript_10784/g.19672 Transcript_10784/m.19672 type:complete len:99 (+) Transcript_10784:49-345(+)|eukprot:CAMPEP_0175059524 /NCGR_PEP_ID=MMETSP0052_2-20121109/12481_1 /TAXON_ID=51329 ORGANISM="Polytomella parva, Strain SAG 63-3" /NCGR_SAMPLE_ID=MMETSP0052_2 /ASSEMBLY_ACC=CAM_ASM_000194 /LENGTH=98 /DNA_ID=CAMNT_0016325085 /DNA_START=39 /DNA_END=335 /DNA_ORIENTATION=+